MNRNSLFIVVGLLVLTALLYARPASAAEVIQQRIFVLAEDEVIDDNLYVAATEIDIDGRINGDLIVLPFGVTDDGEAIPTSSLVTINGVVTGDVLVAASGLRINGEVQGDVRSFVFGVELNGTIGGDLLTTGGVTNPLGAEVGAPVGINLTETAQVGGDLMFAGTQADLSGNIDGRMRGSATLVTFEKLTVQRDVDLRLSAFTTDEESRVLNGNTFRYSSPEPLSVSSQIAETIEYNEIESDTGVDWFFVMRSIIGIIAGSALLGWILLRYQPSLLMAPAHVLRMNWAQPAMTGFSFFFGGALAAGFVSVIAGLFFGFGAFFAVGGLFFMLMAFVWYISPMIIGMWIALRAEQPGFQGFIVGVSVIAILINLPALGGFVHFVIFLIALGALLSVRVVTGSAPENSQ